MIINNEIKQIKNNSSSIFIYNRNNDSKIISSPKRKLFISPSKDLLTFFDKTNFSKYISLKSMKNQKNQKNQKENLKLTLNTKPTQRNSNQKQQFSDKKLKYNKNYNFNEVKTIYKSKSIMSQPNINDNIYQNDEQRFQKLKKQVDIIRRKYNLNNRSKVSLDKSNIKNIYKSARNSTRDISDNQSFSNKINYSKNKNDKINCETIKLDKQDARKILKKKNSSHVNDKLRLTFSMNSGSACQKLQSSLRSRKNSTESQINNNTMTIQDEDMKTNCTKNVFQFTFGNMSMMDYQNSKSFNSNNKLKLKI